jgi:D-psicose/D-tagatose/L-ribulose 3-epimerase
VISACEWIFGGRPPEDVVALLAAAGYDAMEVNGEPARDAGALRDTLAAAGLAASGTTAICSWPTDDRDLAHSDRDARRRAVDYYRGCAELAAAVGTPTVGLIPAAVGRLEPLTSRGREWQWAVEGVREVAHHAGERGVHVAVEAINRYETHLVNRVEQALELADATGVDGVGVIADAFHMQLEETDSAIAVAHAGSRLAALHVADSNRLGLGHGQLDVAPIVEAAHGAGFDGPVVLECTAPGPNPFDADKGADAMPLLDRYVHESADVLKGAMQWR